MGGEEGGEGLGMTCGGEEREGGYGWLVGGVWGVKGRERRCYL